MQFVIYVHCPLCFSPMLFIPLNTNRVLIQGAFYLQNKLLLICSPMSVIVNDKRKQSLRGAKATWQSPKRLLHFVRNDSAIVYSHKSFTIVYHFKIFVIDVILPAHSARHPGDYI